MLWPVIACPRFPLGQRKRTPASICPLSKPQLCLGNDGEPGGEERRSAFPHSQPKLTTSIPFFLLPKKFFFVKVSWGSTCLASG